MKKQWKALAGLGAVAAAAILAPLALMAALIGFLFNDNDLADKEDIFRQVRQNQSLLEECVETGDYEAALQLRVIKEVDPGEHCVDFYCGGAGIAPSSTYCGFFYSREDDLYAIWCAPPTGQTLTADGDGWRWEQPGGDNRYYVEHICGHFYYYQASF